MFKVNQKVDSKVDSKHFPKFSEKFMFRTPIRLTHMANCVLHRSSHSQKFFKVEALRCCRNIHGKVPVLESLFDKVGGLKTWNFIIKRLQRRCFPVNIAEFLRTFLWSTSGGCFSLQIIQGLII